MSSSFSSLLGKAASMAATKVTDTIKSEKEAFEADKAKWTPELPTVSDLIVLTTAASISDHPGAPALIQAWQIDKLQARATDNRVPLTQQEMTHAVNILASERPTMGGLAAGIYDELKFASEFKPGSKGKSAPVTEPVATGPSAEEIAAAQKQAEKQAVLALAQKQAAEDAAKANVEDELARMRKGLSAPAEKKEKKQVEHIVSLDNGRTLRFDGTPRSCMYVRLCDKDGNEVERWLAAQWNSNPAYIMSAILGTLPFTVGQ